MFTLCYKHQNIGSFYWLNLVSYFTTKQNMMQLKHQFTILFLIQFLSCFTLNTNRIHTTLVKEKITRILYWSKGKQWIDKAHQYAHSLFTESCCAILGITQGHQSPCSHKMGEGACCPTQTGARKLTADHRDGVQQLCIHIHTIPTWT